MFPDSKNPFAAAAAPTNGSAPSPFQPAATNGSVVRSPFESAALAQGSQTSLPQPKRAPESPAWPFALVEETAPAAASPFEPALVEPTEGFAFGEAVPPRLVDPAPAPAPVAMPHARAYYGVNGNHNDPFAAPSPSGFYTQPTLTTTDHVYISVVAVSLKTNTITYFSSIQAQHRSSLSIIPP